MRIVPAVSSILIGAALAGAAEPLRLNEALVLAANAANTEQARLELARKQAEYLETLRKVQVELRPSLGLFGFSNPLLLAASLGSGLSIGRRNAPPPLTLDNAWFDVAMAETSAERSKTRARMEAARAFYALLEKQELVGRNRETMRLRKAHLTEVGRMVAASRVTALDRIEAENAVLDAEAEAAESEAGLEAAAMRLAALIGRPGDEGLAARDEEGSELAALPASGVLLERAFRQRPDMDALRRRSESFRRMAGGRIQASGVNAGYSYVGNVSGRGTRTADNFLLGGNTARVDLGLTIKLRNTGEKEAQRQVMEARARLLDTEMAALEREIRTEAASLRAAVLASDGRVRVAGRKLALARQAEAMAAARAGNGLAAPGSDFPYRQQSLRAETEYRQAAYGRKANIAALLVLCGFDDPLTGARSLARTTPAPVADARREAELR